MFARVDVYLYRNAGLAYGCKACPLPVTRSWLSK